MSAINNEPKHVQMAVYAKLFEIYRTAESGDAEGTRRQFQGLLPAVCNRIYGLIYQLAQSPRTKDYQWGQTHVFDKLPRLQTAIQQVAFDAFDTLAQEDRNYVTKRVWHYAGSPTTGDLCWGEHHAKDVDKVKNLLLSLTENAHANPWSLENAFNRLQQANILTQENRALVIAHANPERLAIALARRSLGTLPENPLIQENWQLIIAHEDPATLIEALAYLRGNILTQENLQAVIAHQKPMSLAKAIAELQIQLIPLMQETRQMVIAAQYPLSLARALISLHLANILTQANRQVIIQENLHNENFWDLSTVLAWLQRGNILTQESFDALISRPALYTQEMIEAFLYRLPVLQMHRADLPRTY